MANSRRTSWLDAADVMQMLHIHRSTLTRWRKCGYLSAHRIPGKRRVYFDKAEIDALLSANAIQENHRFDKTIFVKKG